MIILICWKCCRREKPRQRQTVFCHCIVVKRETWRISMGRAGGVWDGLCLTSGRERDCPVLSFENLPILFEGHHYRIMVSRRLKWGEQYLGGFGMPVLEGNLGRGERSLLKWKELGGASILLLTRVEVWFRSRVSKRSFVEFAIPGYPPCSSVTIRCLGLSCRRNHRASANVREPSPFKTKAPL